MALKKKILFVNPSVASSSSILSTGAWRFPPVSIISLAAYTDTDIWDIQILDEVVDDFVIPDVDLVAITSMTFTINRAYQIAEICRKRNIYTVLGGYHATFMTDEAAQFVDTVIAGEAENIWPVFLQDFINKKPLPFYKGTTVDLANLKIPRHDLISEKYDLATVQTSRGCPFNCAFCTVTKMAGSKYRQRNIEDIIKELKSIKQKQIIFIDDNIVGVKKSDFIRAKELFKQMIAENINKSWVGFTSFNIVEDEETLDLAKKSGCRMLNIGIESDNLSALKNVNKGQNLRVREKYSINEAIDIIHKYGISVYSTLIFGFDTDTKSDLRNRIKFINKSKIDAVSIAPLTPLPGSDIYNLVKAENRLIYNNFPEDWNKFGVVETTMIPKNVSVKILNRFLKKSFVAAFGKYSINRRYRRTLANINDERIANTCRNLNLSYRKLYLGK